MATRKITNRFNVNDATTFATDTATRLAHLVPSVRAALPQVKSEIATLAAFRVARGNVFARECVVSAMTSANNPFGNQTRLSRGILPYVRRGYMFRSQDELEDALRTHNPQDANGIPNRWGMTTQLAEVIFPQWARIMSITADDMTLENLLTFDGIAHKVASFALHMFDPTYPVWTCDLHIFRLADTVIGNVRAGGYVASNAKAYEITCNAFVQWARDVFPNEDIFAVQWALWNVLRGSHECHTVLFED